MVVVVVLVAGVQSPAADIAPIRVRAFFAAEAPLAARRLVVAAAAAAAALGR